MKRFIFTAVIFVVGNFLYSQSIYVEYLETKKISEDSKILLPKGMFAVSSKSFLYLLEYKNGESLYKNHPKSLNIKPYDTTYVENGIEVSERLFYNQVEKIVYKNYAANELRFTQPKGIDEIAYVKDKLIDWNWKIEEETKMINKFLCKKATAYVRGLHFTVWFTEDIPIDCGPEYVNGLPGLIIYAENDFRRFEMNKIIFNADVKIEKPNFDNQRIYTMDELYKTPSSSTKNQNSETEVVQEGNTTITKKKIIIRN
ncbi:GLPGLI family protein [Flavobacterium sp. j3]|uniref:GLPGLI family protein n=1 Tax=Flavobacterium aureirubrum TaxID=3133147 RepID=A0ABU9N0X6_9FLAO